MEPLFGGAKVLEVNLCVFLQVSYTYYDRRKVRKWMNKKIRIIWKGHYFWVLIVIFWQNIIKNNEINNFGYKSNYKYFCRFQTLNIFMKPKYFKYLKLLFWKPGRHSKFYLWNIV